MAAVRAGGVQLPRQAGGHFAFPFLPPEILLSKKRHFVRLNFCCGRRIGDSSTCLQFDENSPQADQLGIQDQSKFHAKVT